MKNQNKHHKIHQSIQKNQEQNIEITKNQIDMDKL